MLDDGVGITLDSCVWVFMGRLLDDGVGIALDGCAAWVRNPFPNNLISVCRGWLEWRSLGPSWWDFVGLQLVVARHQHAKEMENS